MEVSSKDRIMMFHIPDDPKILEILGIISLRHAHLDYILRMTVKSLGGVTIRQALDATAFEGSGALRERIRKLAKRKLGESKAFIQLQALLEQCRRATEKRNGHIHNIWAHELDGDHPQVRTNDHEWKPIPTIEELNALATELSFLTDEINAARLKGFLAEALAGAK